MGKYSSKGSEKQFNKHSGFIEGAGEVKEQKIVKTIENNYMPYAMSVIMSRAIPEIDGFKPSHRKLLYTMYKMGLLNSQRTKSANIVGQTMKLNPHGDSAIYDTMVRLSRGNEALLHPYIDSKGNFGKFYSRDMAYAASRYTEAKLDEICTELFKDIEKNTVDFVDNYDNTLKEPVLLPASYPSILVNANTGIAVGMASSICPFNLREVCKTAIELIKNKNHDICKTLIAPDFPGGGHIVYQEEKIREIYETGKGGIKVRARYFYDKDSNCIDISSIPSTTTSEAIIEKVIEMVKLGKVKEISDIRDETGLDGLKITIDLKRGFDPDKLMNKLFKITPLEDTFSCNFNILVDSKPKVMGIKEIFQEWILFREKCIKRRTEFDLDKKKQTLHLLYGLKTILVDIDKAISIIRNTQQDSMVIPNLMNGFKIDKIQAEYVSEIKLRHLNREYIIKKTDETQKLEGEIQSLENILKDKSKIEHIIMNELEEVAAIYGKPRKSMIIYPKEIETFEDEEDEIDYPVTLFFTREGYFKKITPQSLRLGSEHKLKEGDKILQSVEGSNNSDLLFFSNKSKVYKMKANMFPDSKASVFGDFIGAKVSAAEDEEIVYMAVTKDYSGFMLFFFEDGRVAKVDMKSYLTKTNRKKLVSAFSDKAKLVRCFYLLKDFEFFLVSSAGKAIKFSTSLLNKKTSKNTMGVHVMTLKKDQKLAKVSVCSEKNKNALEKYNVKNIPVVGYNYSGDIDEMQLTF